ncbi:MlaE family ABC transporter permease [Acidicapsa ligni]|uniref:MlaE family ABC transporter permease n=1 Tax=Acidicapsa ligni TaxID=542300 RepID=UPI0021E07B7F|nr:ABC transporter permease [Acidicapsa ligni]
MPIDPLDVIAKRMLLAVQDYTLFCSQAVANLFRRPHYWSDVLAQCDLIGVGSLPIVVLTGFFTGGVLALQSAASLAQFGAQAYTGRFVSLSMIRELAPVLTGLMVSGRNASGMASELGSMVVTEQIDAMRALGTDPMKKLVSPRVLATVIMLFLLTIVSDTVGTAGGAFVSVFMSAQNGTQYFTSAYQALVYSDIAQGLTKPLFFGFIISTIGCFFGMKTSGGTQGVGRSTTQAVVASSVLIIFSDFILSRVMLWIFPGF